MWLIILSDQLQIVALVSLYLTNKLIWRGLIQERPKPFPRREYAVLAVVSNCYSPLLGKFPRVTHPSATKVTRASSGPSFDLHVLGLPPAFVLSQDQTLKLNSRIPAADPKIDNRREKQELGPHIICDHLNLGPKTSIQIYIYVERHKDAQTKIDRRSTTNAVRASLHYVFII